MTAKNHYHLDAQEKKLRDRIISEASTLSSLDYNNSIFKVIFAFYTNQGLTRAEVVELPLYKLAAEYRGQKLLEEGLARPSDYRDQIASIIRDHFPTRKAFCEKVGIAEDMLSHVLARRRHFSMESLQSIAEKLNYRVTLEPNESP